MKKIKLLILLLPVLGVLSFGFTINHHIAKSELKMTVSFSMSSAPAPDGTASSSKLNLPIPRYWNIVIFDQHLKTDWSLMGVRRQYRAAP